MTTQPSILCPSVVTQNQLFGDKSRFEVPSFTFASWQVLCVPARFAASITCSHSCFFALFARPRQGWLCTLNLWKAKG